MPTQPGPGELADAVLRTLLDSGRRLLGARTALLAAGPPDRLTIRTATGTEPVASGTPVVERGRGPDGVVAPVRLSGSPADGIAIDAVDAVDAVDAMGADGADAFAIAGSVRDGRLVLVLVGADPAPPDERVTAHLLATAASVLSAERSAAFGMIRENLHEREEERRRWARELHDETLQQLGALQVLLTSALPKARGAEVADGSPSAGFVDAVRLGTELLAGQIGNLRQLITELRPAALDDLGLTPPLQALARRTEQLSGLRVTLHASLRYADGVIGTRLLPDIELAVYRVVQEALTNIRRHSTATRAAVTVVEDDDTVVAEITDDGRGFDPARATGFGLAGMRERAELAGGTLQVAPARPGGRGTTVRLVVPARHR